MKCSSPLNSKKILCLICSNMILCSKYEPIHGHPCVIYKSKINISLSFIGDKGIYLRRKKSFLLPIKIINHSNNITIFSSDIVILIKGNKFLNIMLLI